MQLDHVALAVRSIDAARERLCLLTGYEPVTHKVTNTRQQVNVQFLSKAGSLDIKLIEPSGAGSPLVEFVKRGGGLHHLAFRVQEVEEACAELTGGGARVLVAPQPGEAFDDHLIAFVFLGAGLNAEIIDSDERRARLSPQPAAQGDAGADEGV